MLGTRYQVRSNNNQVRSTYVRQGIVTALLLLNVSQPFGHPLNQGEEIVKMYVKRPLFDFKNSTFFPCVWHGGGLESDGAKG